MRIQGEDKMDTEGNSQEKRNLEGGGLGRELWVVNGGIKDDGFGWGMI